MTFRNPLTSIAALATGQAGTSRITVGTNLPAGLAAAGVTSAIIFWNTNGSYYAIASFAAGHTTGNMRFMYAPDSTTTATEQAFWGAGGGVTVEENMAFPIGSPARIQPVFTPVFPSFAIGWASIGGGYADFNYQIDAMNFVKVRGLAGYSGGGTATIATGLPAPKDAENHFYGGVDVSSLAACVFEVNSAGTLTLQTGLTVGHAYSAEFGYQA